MLLTTTPAQHGTFTHPGEEVSNVRIEESSSFGGASGARQNCPGWSADSKRGEKITNRCESGLLLLPGVQGYTRTRQLSPQY